MTGELLLVCGERFESRFLLIGKLSNKRRIGLCVNDNATIVENLSNERRPIFRIFCQEALEYCDRIDELLDVRLVFKVGEKLQLNGRIVNGVCYASF